MSFDLIVIGGGSGGVRAGRLAASKGMSVAVIEADRWGGTCVNLGCVPKKMMKYAADFATNFADARDYGWNLGAEPHFDWPHFVRQRDEEVRRLNQIYAGALERAGATLIRGRGRLRAPGQVEVGDELVKGRRVLLATGGHPYTPSIPGAEYGMSSDQLFGLAEQPKHLLVVGGGFIALEFACIFQALGTQVSLVYRGDALLRGFDAGVRQHLTDALKAKGLYLRLQTDIREIRQGEGARRQVHLTDGSEMEADQILFATGRRANTQGLWHEELDIRCNPDGSIQVDANFRTSVPEVYALGDVVGRLALTPVAIAEAKALVQHWIEGVETTLDYQNMPFAVFSSPGVACVGLTEEQALQRGKPVLIYETRFRSLRLSLTQRKEQTYMRMLVDEASRRVLGVHLVGEEVAEILQCAAVALNMGATKEDFDRTVGIHPTTAEELVTMSRPPRRVLPA